MSRKAKYSKEFKINIVKQYIKGKPASTLAREYNIPRTYLISRWVHKYMALGDGAFDTSSSNKTYSKEFKLKVIKEYLNGHGTYEDLANKYDISTDTIVSNWVKKYNEGIEILNYNPKGDVYTMKSRKTTFEERIEIINYVLEHDFDYKGAADKYSVPYANVYNWVSKYNKFGKDSIKDSRGRPSSKTSTKELTIEEKLIIENEKLKQELERKNMIIEVLKKNEEIRIRMGINSQRLNKKINTKR